MQGVGRTGALDEIEQRDLIFFLHQGLHTPKGEAVFIIHTCGLVEDK